MGKLFGTDGIRGVAGEEPITDEMAKKLGRAVVAFCRRRGIDLDVVVGRDTRASGKKLEDGVSSGVISAGGNAYSAGQIPTPGVAYLTRALAGGAGVVISASHNPYEYNGFKVFSHQGFKLSEAEESEIEELLRSPDSSDGEGDETGKAHSLQDASERYLAFLTGSFPRELDIRGLKIVLDCANGATCEVAPALFKRLGADVEALFVTPDGVNINRNCGSQHTATLCRKVLDRRADLGLAFDGDGDRLIAVDEKGRALTGDQILTVLAKMLEERGELKNHTVVSTVMSNMGLSVALKEFGAKQIVSAVGDRCVLEEMRRAGAVLGGEDSGHIIFLQHHTTGDGILSGLQLLAAMKRFDEPLSRLSRLMSVFPQVLVNVPVRAKPDISTVPEVMEVIREAEASLAGKGRVLVRYSGTEPVCRVMVEGRQKEAIERQAARIAEAIERRLNHSNSSDSSVG